MHIRSLRALVVEALAVSAIMWLLVSEFERRGAIARLVEVFTLPWQTLMKAFGG